MQACSQQKSNPQGYRWSLRSVGEAHCEVYGLKSVTFAHTSRVVEHPGHPQETPPNKALGGSWLPLWTMDLGGFGEDFTTKIDTTASYTAIKQDQT